MTFLAHTPTGPNSLAAIVATPFCGESGRVP
jgi:hypothetical protein